MTAFRSLAFQEAFEEGRIPSTVPRVRQIDLVEPLLSIYLPPAGFWNTHSRGAVKMTKTASFYLFRYRKNRNIITVGKDEFALHRV